MVAERGEEMPRMLRKIFAAFRLLSAKQIKGTKKEQGK